MFLQRDAPTARLLPLSPPLAKERRNEYPVQDERIVLPHTRALRTQWSARSPRGHAVCPMNATEPNCSFTSALLLTDAESNAIVDRRALREAGIGQIRVMTSGVQAARLLAAQAAEDVSSLPGIVLCHKTLADMDGIRLTELMRLHPRLLSLPLLMVVGNDDEAARMDALLSGSSGVLVRPYSQNVLRRLLADMAADQGEDLHEGLNRLGADAFDAALTRYETAMRAAGSPEQAFREGMRRLHERDWNGAIQAFHKAMRQIALKGESEMGLAAAWRGKGDMGKYRHYLNEAAHTFTRATQWHKARVAYARLLREAPQTPSPFLAVAETLVRAEKFDEAVETLAAGYDLGSTNEASDRLVLACLFTERPEHSLVMLRDALDSSALDHALPALKTEMHEAFQARTLAAKARAGVLRERKGIAARYEAPEESLEDGLAPLPDMPFGTMNKNDRTESRHGKDREAKTPVRFPETARQSTLPPRPLLEEDMESALFPGLPGLNDALTVARFTWKILRNSKK